MSNLSIDKATLVDTARAVVLAGMSGGTAAASLTSASGAVTVTFTTDNPNITANGSVVVPDGDNTDGNGSLAAALEWAIELDAKAAAMRTDLSALRTAVNALVTGTNVYDLASLAAMTATAPSAVNKLIGVTYTTDNPNITPNNAITVADGAAPTVANLFEMATELNKEGYLLWNDLSAVYTRMKQVVDQKSFQGVTALPALTSNATMVTITYSANNPSITPDGAVTIADGDATALGAGNANTDDRWHFLVELKDQFEKQRADLLAVHTALDTAFDKASVV